MSTVTSRIHELLGTDADALLGYQAKGFDKSLLHLPGPDFVDRVIAPSDRSPQVLRNFQSLLSTGRLGGTGLRLDPARRSGHRALRRRELRAQSDLLRPRKHREAGHRRRVQRRRLDAWRARLGRAQVRAQDPVPRQAQSQRVPDVSEQLRPDHVRQRQAGVRHGRGRPSARRSTSARRSRRGRSRKSREASQQAHELGLVTVLWCYLRNSAFKTQGQDYHAAADLTGQANHLGVTIEADIIKQKLPTTNGGYNALKFGKTHTKRVQRSDARRPSDRAVAATRWRTATWAVAG